MCRRLLFGVVLVMMIAIHVHAQASFAGRGFVLAEQYETGPFGTFVSFGVDGSYGWEQSAGDHTVERIGSYDVSEVERRQTSSGPHEYGRLHLEYEERLVMDVPLGEPSRESHTLYYAFANDVLVLYNDTAIVEILADAPEATLYQANFVASASSELTENLSRGPVTYAANAIRPDAPLSDFWAEGAPGPGRNSVVDLAFTYDSVVRRLVLFNGVYRREDLFRKNARIRELEIATAGGGSSPILLQLPDWREPVIAVPIGMGRTAGARLSVRDVYPGSSWEDLCLTALVVLADAE